MKKNAKKGFTIIEMVIVIAIIGILAAVLIPTYGNVVANANESAAMQTARSTMTNWLANSTTAAGVPTSGNDNNGNPFYAAYFEYKNGDSGQLYQFRYTSGGVERTDNNPSMYVNFTQTDKEINGLPVSGLPKYIATAYLTTPAQDTGFDETKYAVSLYKQTVNTSTNYYVKYSAKGAYTCGGADVYAAVGAGTKIYLKDATSGEYGTGVVLSEISDAQWTETPNTTTGAAAAATTYTVTYKLATEHGLGATASAPAAETGIASGTKITLPAQIAEQDVIWYTEAAATNAVTLADGKYEVKGNVDLYAKLKTP